MSAALVLSFSGLLLWACAATAKPGSFAVADCSGTPLPRLRRRQGFIGDHRLQRGAPRVARWWRWWHLVLVAQSTPRWPASPGAGHARAVHDDASHTRRMLPASLPASMSAAYTCFPHRQRPAFPTAFRPAERSAPEMQLEWRSSTRLRNPMPNRLEPDSP
jgi:hypothetical protein